MARRKRGRSVRAARAGQLGLGKPSKGALKKADRGKERATSKREEAAAQRKLLEQQAVEAVEGIPHSFVIHRGVVGKYARRLEHDLRQVMEPYTARELKVQKRNNIKDFVANASPLAVTHIMVITRSEQSLQLRIIRLSQGPTLTFRIHEYSLCKHVLSAQKRPVFFQELFRNSPLVVMNGFGAKKGRQLHLVQTIVQNMFPSINLDTLNLGQVRRCVLMSYDSTTDLIEFRHYAIKTVPTGVAKPVKKLIQSKVPDLSRYKDISDFFVNPGQLSESEYEDDEAPEVALAQDLNRRSAREGQLTNIRLTEIGPRMSLQLLKIQQGIDEGDVLYSRFHEAPTNETEDGRPQRRQRSERPPQAKQEVKMEE